MTISSPPVAPPTAPRRRRSRPTRRRVGMLVAAVASVLAGSTPSSAAPQVELASVTPTGTAIEPAWLLDFSADGRYVVFASSMELVPGNPPPIPIAHHLYRRDVNSGSIELVSESMGGGYSTTPYWDWDQAAISDDGRYVAFSSAADDLVAGDTNGFDDVFVRDMVAGTTTLLSQSPTGQPADGPSWNVAISGDGDVIAFNSDAANLVADDDNGRDDIVVVERTTGVASLASVDSTGKQSDGDSRAPALSYDGRFVAFESLATTLTSVPATNWFEIFVHDRTSGETEQISTTPSGGPANQRSSDPDISADGNLVAFDSHASDLVANDTNNEGDVFVADRSNDTIERVSVRSNGVEANAQSAGARISGDGSTVVFESDATNLVWNDSNQVVDVFLHRIGPSRTFRLSRGPGGWNPNNGSVRAMVNRIGTAAVFWTEADNILSVPSPASGIYLAQQ